MKKHSSTIILIIMFLAGLSLLLYPTVSDYWNSLHQSRAIASYVEDVAKLDSNEGQQILESARTYNRNYRFRDNAYVLDEQQMQEYMSQLDLTGTGIMGYVEIPAIKVSLPIYHGTSDAVLQIAVGHLEWTSLPVGGLGTHCVISGHRGLPSAKLFTDLDELEIGDVFMIRILDEVLTYEVDQILIVEPTDVEALHPVQGEDLFTLVTCTPYGVNSHRLLVRGHRIENIEEAKAVYVTADAIQIEPVVVAPMLAAPILLVLLIVVLLPGSNRKRRDE